MCQPALASAIFIQLAYLDFSSFNSHKNVPQVWGLLRARNETIG
jgi:hypothetical protein